MVKRQRANTSVFGVQKWSMWFSKTNLGESTFRLHNTFFKKTPFFLNPLLNIVTFKKQTNTKYLFFPQYYDYLAHTKCSFLKKKLPPSFQVTFNDNYQPFLTVPSQFQLTGLMTSGSKHFLIMWLFPEPFSRTAVDTRNLTLDKKSEAGLRKLWNRIGQTKAPGTAWIERLGGGGK